MKKTLTLLYVFSLFLLFSCTKPSGNEVTLYFSAPSSYYRLYLNDGMEVTVTDEVENIVITADENVMDKICVDYKNGRLSIYRSDYAVIRTLKAKVLLPYHPGLHDLDVGSYCTFTSDYGLEGDDIKLKASTYATIDIDYILANHLKIDLDDHADLFSDVDVFDLTELTLDHADATLTGSTSELKLKLQNNAKLVEKWLSGGYGFTCDYCYGTMTNQSKAYLHCYDEASVELTLESFLYLSGDPYIDDCYWDETSGIRLY